MLPASQRAKCDRAAIKTGRRSTGDWRVEVDVAEADVELEVDVGVFLDELRRSPRLPWASRSPSNRMGRFSSVSMKRRTLRNRN